MGLPVLGVFAVRSWWHCEQITLAPNPLGTIMGICIPHSDDQYDRRPNSHGVLYDLYGNYELAFTIMALLCSLTGGLCFWFAKPPAILKKIRSNYCLTAQPLHRTGTLRAIRLTRQGTDVAKTGCILKYLARGVVTTRDGKGAIG